MEALTRGHLTVGLAWEALHDALPLGWDLVLLQRHGYGEDALWTVTAEPVTNGARMRARRAGVQRNANHFGKGKGKCQLQAQHTRVAEALLTLIVETDKLPDALFDPFTREESAA